MCYGGKSASKSIYILYHTEKQIVTKILLPHSGFVLAVAKVNKISGFGKDFFCFFDCEFDNFCYFCRQKSSETAISEMTVSYVNNRQI